MLWEWRNDPVVRANSFSSNPIPWDEHVSWLREKLVDPHCLIYVVVDEQDIPVGQVRFDTSSEGSAEVAVSIDAKERDRGYGSAALQLACQRVLKEHGIGKVLALVKEDNKASINAFAMAGFINKGLKDFEGHKVVEMVCP